MPLRASEARKTLVPLIGRGDADRDAVEIVSRKGNVVLMPADGDAWVRLVSDRSAREDHTLVCLVDGEDLIILQVRYHY